MNRLSIHLEPYKEKPQIYRQGDKFILQLEKKTRVILSKETLEKILEMVRKYLRSAE